MREADSADIRAIISHPIVPAARELIIWQALWTLGTFFISLQLRLSLKSLLYKTMCFLPRCTTIYMTKMSYQYQSLHAIKIPNTMKLLLPIPLIKGFMCNQCITRPLFIEMLYGTPCAGDCTFQWDLFSGFWRVEKCHVHVV